jgi:GNAT superfamily N-acetyltransferase
VAVAAPTISEVETPSRAIEIRDFNEGDLVALQRHIPSRHHPYRAAAHRSGAATFMIAWQDGEPVGYLLLKWAGADEEIVHRLVGDCPELNAITVASGLRSRGIGTKLVHEAERRTSARGNSRIGLAVALDNPRARALYERLGYSAWDHGSFDVSWEVSDEPSRRESATCIYLLKPLLAGTAFHNASRSPVA